MFGRQCDQPDVTGLDLGPQVGISHHCGIMSAAVLLAQQWAFEVSSQTPSTDSTIGGTSHGGGLSGRVEESLSRRLISADKGGQP